MSSQDHADQALERAEPKDEQLIGMELLRASEAAALNVFQWIGKGDKIAADDAATDAFRGMLNIMEMCGTCTIGEGIKDEAPGIFVGEKLGTWREGSPPVSIAIDPIDGTTLTSKGLPGALSVIAAAKGAHPEDNALAAIPSYYVDKIAVGPTVKEGAGHVRLGDSVEHNLEIVALTLGKRVKDLVVCVLDRPRHAKLIADVRATGAAIRLIGDGDIAAAIAPCMTDNIVDVYMGIGGSPEAVLAAAAIQCLGGEILAKPWPRDDEERERLIAEGHEEILGQSFNAADMVRGQDTVFCATGITDNPLLRGLVVQGHIAITHSVVMRARSRTVRYVKAYHDLNHKTIRLASESRHIRL